MSIITRYVLAETLKVLAVATLVMIFVMLVVGLGREVWEHSLPLGCLFWLIPYLLPDALRVALPVAVLLAAVYTFSRLSGFNELLAVKAAGVSPLPLLAPVLALAFLLSLFTVWMNDLAAGWGRQGMQQVIIRAAEEVVYSALRRRQRFEHPRVLIEVRQVNGRQLLEPTLVIYGSRPNSVLTITAQEAELMANPHMGTLKLRLRNGTVDAGGQWRIAFPDVYEREIRLSDKIGELWGKSPSSLSLRQIPEVETHCLREIRQHQATPTHTAAVPLPAGALAAPAEEPSAHERLQNLYDYLHRLRTEPYRRWAAGFSCLAFTLVGSAMAMRLRQAEILTAFFLCFAPILVAYYPLLAWTVDAAKHGAIPPWGVWLGNFLLLLWGGALLWYELEH